jgi:hypothetical protein
MAEASMFPNFKSMDLWIKKLFTKISKKIMVKACHSLFKGIFLVFLCNYSNVSYREKRRTLWPVSRRVKSAKTLVVFPNFVWVLYLFESVLYMLVYCESTQIEPVDIEDMYHSPKKIFW